VPLPAIVRFLYYSSVPNLTWESVRERAPIDRKYIDIVKVHIKLNKKNIKKGPGVLRRSVMK
jgi:hypothetical protein